MVGHGSRRRMGAGALERKGGAGSGDGALGAGSKLFGPIEAILVCSRRGIVRRDSWMLDVACLWERGRRHMKAGSASNRRPSGRYGNLSLVRIGLGQRRHPLIPPDRLHGCVQEMTGEGTLEIYHFRGCFRCGSFAWRHCLQSSCAGQRAWSGPF